MVPIGSSRGEPGTQLIEWDTWYPSATTLSSECVAPASRSMMGVLRESRDPCASTVALMRDLPSSPTSGLRSAEGQLLTGAEEVVEFVLPLPHERPIVGIREPRHEFVARRTETGVAVADMGAEPFSVASS